MGNFLGSYKMVEIISNQVSAPQNQTEHFLQRTMMNQYELDDGALDFTVTITSMASSSKMIQVVTIMRRVDPVFGRLIGPVLSKTTRTFAQPTAGEPFVPEMTQENETAGFIQTLDIENSDWFGEQKWVLGQPDQATCIMEVGDGSLVLTSPQVGNTSMFFSGKLETKYIYSMEEDNTMVCRSFFGNEMVKTSTLRRV